MIFISCVPWKRRFLPENIRRLYRENPPVSYYSEKPEGFPEEFYSLRPLKGERVFKKSSYDAFSNPLLDRFLRKMSVKTLLISGVFSDGCVNATINGAFSRGYSLKIISDLVETTDSKTRQKIQRLLKEFTWPFLYGQVVESRDLGN